MSVNRNLVLGIVLFGGLATAIFFLPKSAVNNKKLETAEASTAVEADSVFPKEGLHEADPEVEKSILALKSSLSAETEPEAKAEIEEKIARGFLKAQRFDSAGLYFERAMATGKDGSLAFDAGSSYFEGLTFVTNPSKAENLAGKARELLSKVPESDSRYVEAQAKSALTLVNSPNPMQGILKLRDLAGKHPENMFVAYQLGVLSFQSGQYDKAIGRFQTVTEKDPGNVNAWFFLAQSLQQTGKKAEALQAVEKGMKLAKEDDTKASFEELKKQLTGN
jgi:tetratricopeptide (TPR) repeat protein